MVKRELTPAQKAKATREAKAARKEVAAATRAITRPQREAWKRVLVMVKALGAIVRPSTLPDRFRVWTKEQREERASDMLGKIRTYVEEWEAAKQTVRAAKIAAKVKRPSARKAARHGK